eukprot:TRINITY_DN10028_c0_g1_i20.p1 TRINITY_DN10028_c0_g1~~TRINITY_DN10028_c0_g1_i20.p1  ORF type:complete len:237 (-),score=6.23 TRINITY_DN10028_c0_g1_i20:345-1055(-)
MSSFPLLRPDSLNLSRSLSRSSASPQAESALKRSLPSANGKLEGHWSAEEHRRFLEGTFIVLRVAIKLYGKNWKKIEEHIGTRNGTQIRSHAQKYSLKLCRKKLGIKQSHTPIKAQHKGAAEKKIVELRKCTNDIMTRIMTTEEMLSATKKNLFLNSLKKECNRINDELHQILPQIIIGTLIWQRVEPEHMRGWSEILRDLVTCWRGISELLMQCSQGQNSSCKFVRELLYSERLT